MQKAEIQCVLKRLHEELDQFIETIREMPYLALPAERSEVICFADRIRELGGYDADEILADRTHWASLIYPDDRQKVFAAYAKCKNWGVSFEIEYRIVHKDGLLRYVRDKGDPLFDDKGNVVHIEGTIVTIDQSETAEGIVASCVPRATVFSNSSLQTWRKIKVG
jgi:PAS domain S-box-containing protein